MNLGKKHTSPCRLLNFQHFSSSTFLAAMRILRVIGCQSILNVYQYLIQRYIRFGYIRL